MRTDKPTSLNNCTVLVTRPQHQTEELCAMISAAGGASIHFPVLEIVPLELDDSDNKQSASSMIAQLADYDLAIFISANAVEQGVRRVLQQKGQWPAQLQIAVVGRASAQALEQRGLEATICPDHGFNSEALLALPVMQQLQGKRIAIFRGQGGREKLAHELSRRGASVDYVEVYRRRCADINLSQLQQGRQLQAIKVIIVASNESLQNLYDIAGTVYREWLLNIPLAVISHRCAELSTQLGFRHYCIASEASNQALFEAVQQCWSGVSPGEL